MSKQNGTNEFNETTGLTKFESKLLNLLGLLLVQERQQADQIITLSRAGFSSSEIAKLVGTTPNTVSVTLYQQKKVKKPKSAKK